MSIYAQKHEPVRCWDSGHAGIAGNELADEKPAEAALRSSVDLTAVPYRDLKPHVRQNLRKTWQKHWSEQTDNKLHVIKRHLGRYTTDSHNRNKEVALASLRIGHRLVTHYHLLTESPRPM